MSSVHMNGTAPVSRREKLYQELIHRKAVLTDFQHLPTVIYDWQTAEGPYLPTICHRFGYHDERANGVPNTLMEMKIARQKHLMASNSVMPLIAPYEILHPGDLVHNVRYTISAALEYLNLDGSQIEPRVSHGPDAHDIIIRTTYFDSSTHRHTRYPSYRTGRSVLMGQYQYQSYPSHAVCAWDDIVWS
ncbi:hypothetical protein BCIN_02g05760 [Botrytis cinerea B05.10]|uniref:Uncharacterized protein n=2 Tax=Botryotinia fuckeliana TaxID=40559 RepID=A0A384J9R2_BOTFB|nr:hypothetical protein BCIN_02g05760 [Botrytis cinerea B05.10]ATZ47283.1 hypothetical protein BCIN_02g05760 [Botrytis cinerea B05.10]EMR82935.1 hypothetical protein BcDW1_8484 [Botrytis cinerea BcDW1]